MLLCQKSFVSDLEMKMRLYDNKQKIVVTDSLFLETGERNKIENR